MLKLSERCSTTGLTNALSERNGEQGDAWSYQGGKSQGGSLQQELAAQEMGERDGSKRCRNSTKGMSGRDKGGWRKEEATVDSMGGKCRSHYKETQQ